MSRHPSPETKDLADDGAVVVTPDPDQIGAFADRDFTAIAEACRACGVQRD
jgi:hypothetical protein